LAAEMMSIHAAGMVHCDMKSGNLMLGQDGRLHVIDLGGAKKVGETMNTYSSNGGPEYVLRLQQLESIGVEMQRAQGWYHYYHSYNDPQAEGMRASYWALNSQYNDLQQKLSTIKADVSYDIYSEASVLPGLFFGRAGEKFCDQFWPGSAFASPTYHNATKDMDYEDRTEYFKAAFTGLNNDMRAATGQGYSEEEVQKMSELMARMMDPEPTHRPTSEQVFTHLMELNNISTAEEENIRAGQKYRSEHPMTLKVDATKKEAAQAKLAAARQKVTKRAVAERAAVDAIRLTET
jgi:serine/threonine protein kinase